MRQASIRQEKERCRGYLAAADLVVAALAVVLGRLVAPSLYNEAAAFNPWLYAPLVPCWIISLQLHRQYDFHLRWLGLAGLYRNARSAVVGTLVCVGITYFWRHGLTETSPHVYVIATLFASAFFSLDRVLAIKLFPDRLLSERYLLFGAPPPDTELSRALSNGELPSYVEVVGCLVDENGAASPDPAHSGLPTVGSFRDVEVVLDEYRISHVAVCPDAPRTPALARAAARAETLGATVERVETVYENLTGRAPVLLAGADWGEGLASVRTHPYMTRYKRVLDVAITLAALPLAMLIMAVAALAIKVTSPGPAFYRQKRAGKDGKDFAFTKLRTMVVDAEKETGPVWATENDPRITSVGLILRKLRIDELPQLVSVLRGDMSLVGPRPERPEFVSRLSEQVPFYEKRMLVRPGITGWAQVHHGYDQSLDDVIEKLRYDLYYVRHVNFTLDLQVLLRTFWVMLGRKGAL